ncbi:MAG: hypothetical protein ACRCYV_11700 [Aeromonas sp.]
MKALSDFFAQDLCAPLKNKQWSGGAENAHAVFLRVWQAEINGAYALIYQPDPSQKSPGQSERAAHIAAIKQGKPAYVVILEGEQTAEGTWRHSSYRSQIYPISALIGGDKLRQAADSLFAQINWQQPVLPALLNQQVDMKALESAALKHRPAHDLLMKAIHGHGWQPTRFDSQQGIIYLTSRDGKATAQLVIATAKWLR